jgi:hypothetical protein
VKFQGFETENFVARANGTRRWLFILPMFVTWCLLAANASAKDVPPETWDLSFKTNLSFKQTGVSSKITASGQAAMKIGADNVLTGTGTMTATEHTTGPGVSCTATGAGSFTVTGKRDGERLIFRFGGKGFPLTGTVSAAGMTMPHESSFDPSLPASVDSAIDRKSGAKSMAKFGAAGMKGKTDFSLSNGANVVKVAPEPAGTFPDKPNIWVLEMDASWTTGTLGGSATTTMRGRARFPLPKENGPARGEGPLTMKNGSMVVHGKLVLDGRIEGGVLRFKPRITMETASIKTSGGPATANYGAGLWGGDGEEVSIAVEDDAEASESFTHKASRSSGTTTWTLTGDVQPELVELTVTKGAKQDGIVKPKNWAAVKDGGGEVIVTAVTKPNKKKAWKKIQWTGDTGDPVPGSPNKRRFSRADSKKFHVQAKLGDTTDHVDIWILWAEVKTLCEKSQTTPPKSPKYTALAVKIGKPVFDGTNKLGERLYNGGDMGAGKTAHIGRLTPKGVHAVVTKGWEFRRDKQGYRLGNKVPTISWPKWADDTSQTPCLKLEPDTDDCIYDIDAPTIGGDSHNKTNEAFINFRQFVFWNGDRCSEYAYWSFEARWDFLKDPQVTFIDVAKGKKTKTP